MEGFVFVRQDNGHIEPCRITEKDGETTIEGNGWEADISGEQKELIMKLKQELENILDNEVEGINIWF